MKNSRAEYQKQWRLRQTPEKQAEMRLQTVMWRRKNRLRCRQIGLAHYHRKKREYARKRAEKMAIIRSNPRLNAIFLERRRFFRKEYKAIRRAIISGDDKLTLEQWRSLLAAWGNCCAYCGKRSDELTQDHVIPLSKGGLHTQGNVVPACMDCNRHKSNRDLGDFLMDLDK